MVLDIGNFLISLAAALADLCDPALTPGTDLFAMRGSPAATSKGGPAAFAVLVPYGGPAPEAFPGAYQVARAVTISVQAAAYSQTASLSLGLGVQLYNALYDEDEEPRNNWVIAGKRNGASGALEADPEGDWEVWFVTPAAPPGNVGTDTERWDKTVFNFDVRFERKG